MHQNLPALNACQQFLIGLVDVVLWVVVAEVDLNKVRGSQCFASDFGNRSKTFSVRSVVRTLGLRKHLVCQQVLVDH